MTCKSTDFKKFQKRIRKTLNYGSKRTITSAQITRMLAAFLNQENMDFGLTEKLAEKGYVSPYNMLTAMIYINRLKIKEQEIERFNTSELYLSSLIIATKLLSDGNLEEFVWNDEWASASGLSLPDLNRLELQMLQALNWDVSVSEENFNDALKSVEEWVAKDLYVQNGQLTYSDIFILSRNLGLDSVKEMVQLVVKWLLYIALSYATLILIILSTTAARLPAFKPQIHINLDMLDVPQQNGMLYFPSLSTNVNEYLFTNLSASYDLEQRNLSFYYK